MIHETNRTRSMLAALLLWTAPAVAQKEAPGVVQPAAPAQEEEEIEEAGAIVDPGDNVLSENELVHVVERRRFRTNDRVELFAYLPLQINGKFTEHQGVGAQVGYHLSDGFGLYAHGNYFGTFGLFDGGRQSDFTRELIERGRQQPLTASALSVFWNVAVGVEIQPIYGKFSFFDARIIHFNVFASGGAGLAHTRVQLRAPTGSAARTFGDTGFRPIGSLGGGFRVYLNDSINLRLEIRDLMYSAEVDTINGCNFEDLTNMTKSPPQLGGLSASCRRDTFGPDGRDATAAKDLLKDTTSDVVNQVSFYGGISFLF